MLSARTEPREGVAGSSEGQNGLGCPGRLVGARATTPQLAPPQEKLVSPGQECCLQLPLERRSPAAASQSASRSCQSATGNTGAEACGTVAGSDPSVTSHVMPLFVSLCLRLCHWPQLAHVTSVPGVVRGSGSLPALGCPHPHPAARDGGRVDGSAARPSVVRKCPGVSRVGSSAVDSCPGTRVSPPRELELRLGWSRGSFCVLAPFVTQAFSLRQLALVPLPALGTYWCGSGCTGVDQVPHCSVPLIRLSLLVPLLARYSSFMMDRGTR